MSLTLKERVELYKTAKKPRKEIRLKLEIITNGLTLPKVSKCESKVKAHFKVRHMSKIQPQSVAYAPRFHTSQPQIANTDGEMSELQNLKNRLNSLKISNEIEKRRLKLNIALK